MICKNCGHNFEGNYCNSCGQSSNVQKIDFKQLVDEISNGIFQVNRGIFFTIKELSTRPGNSIREYLNGKRKKHFKPLAFVFLISSIYVLLTYFTGEKTYLGELLASFTEGWDMKDSGSSKTDELPKIFIGLNWLADNFAYATLLLLPFFSFASYLVFIKSKYNYFEHLILNFYLTGQQVLIYFVFSFLYYLFNGEGYYYELIPIILAILYTFWVFHLFFETKKPFQKILLTVLTYFLYFVFTTIVVFLVMITLG